LAALFSSNQAIKLWSHQLV